MRILSADRFRTIAASWLWLLVVAGHSAKLQGQYYGQPDRSSPGDAMIQTYLADKARSIDDRFQIDLQSTDDFQQRQQDWRREYLEMLGLEPDAPRTDLKPMVTGSIERDGIVVEKLHFQSRPGLYVTGNLYRPKAIDAGDKLPAILYLCGHANMGREGNKTAYQSHPVWFAKHGYVCLSIDSLQLGEIAAKHHGTYNLERWWWHSRGYTPAGVECWNGIRAIDYLVTRQDVDRERLGITGISGGGAATFWIAAADPRIRVAAPVSGMADLESYVGHQVINGHCDCMFLYNHHQWPWTRIAALIAPRPMLFVNSDADPIFPMDANERISNRMERYYSHFGAGDRFEALVSIGDHAYREDIRRGVFQFMNEQLKGDARPVLDAHADVQIDQNERELPYFAPSELRVFKDDSDLPKDQINTKIDETFVAKASFPSGQEFGEGDRHSILERLRRTAFRDLPETFESARELEALADGQWKLSSEPGIWHRVSRVHAPADRAKRLVLIVDRELGREPSWWNERVDTDDLAFVCLPRGRGPTEWTRRNPPNFVERSHALLGTTVDVGRVRDLLGTAKWLRDRNPGLGAIHLVARGGDGVLGIYAGLFDRDGIGSFDLVDLPNSHMDEASPQFLSVLRTLDIPQALSLLAPSKVEVQRSTR